MMTPNGKPLCSCKDVVPESERPIRGGGEGGGLCSLRLRASAAGGRPQLADGRRDYSTTQEALGCVQSLCTAGGVNLGSQKSTFQDDWSPNTWLAGWEYLARLSEALNTCPPKRGGTRKQGVKWDRGERKHRGLVQNVRKIVSRFFGSFSTFSFLFRFHEAVATAAAGTTTIWNETHRKKRKKLSGEKRSTGSGGGGAWEELRPSLAKKHQREGDRNHRRPCCFLPQQSSRLLVTHRGKGRGETAVAHPFLPPLHRYVHKKFRAKFSVAGSNTKKPGPPKKGRRETLFDP